jgi:hypothetical protein
MKSSVFLDITLYSRLTINRSFGGTYRFHLQGRRICHARNQRQAGSKQTLFFGPKYGGKMFLPNIGCFSTDCMALYLRRYISSLSKLMEDKSAVEI